MAILESWFIYIAVSIIACSVLLGVKKQRTTGQNPPGPLPLPLVGNLLDLPKEKSWLKFRKWFDMYGDVVQFTAFGQDALILGSATVINELVEQRGDVYSGRPKMVMAKDLMEIDWIFGLQEGQTWRRNRKLLSSKFNQSTIPSYHEIQVDAARRLARELIGLQCTDATPLPELLQTKFGQMALKLVYGLDITDSQDQYLVVGQEVMHAFCECGIPGRFLVDMIPFLRFVPSWLPGAGFKRYAQKIKHQHVWMRNALIEEVKTRMAQDIALPSIAQTMLEEDALLPSDKSQIELIKDTAAVMFLGGFDTTVAPVVCFFLAMLCHPEIQARAQAEIDRVIGMDRLPVLEDRPHLPYVQAVVSECLRWLPIVPQGAPLVATRDDSYNGFFISKGTMVFASIWAVLHDPNEYPDPSAFNPARYLTAEGTLNPDVRDPRTAAFGFGRRSCPGRYVADANIFITVVTLLATLDIVRINDSEGNEIMPKVDVVSGGVMSYPKPFAWSVRTRSQQAKDMLAA